MASSVASRLKARQAEWEASEAEGGFRELPTGEQYSMVIKSATCGPTKSGDHDQVTWELQVTEGDYKGTMAWKYTSLKTSRNVNFFKGELEALDVAVPENFDAIGATLEECDGLHVRVKVVETKDEFPPNYFFQEVLESGVATVAEEVGTTEQPSRPEVKLTAGEVIEMGKADDEEALQRVIDDNGLDINQAEYVTYGEVADLIIDQLKL